MRKIYFFFATILSVAFLHANESSNNFINSSATFNHNTTILPVITGNFSICLPGPTTTQLTASEIPALTNPWMSSNPAVATVNSTGLVTSVSFGNTTIFFTNNLGETAAANVSVSTFPTINAPFGISTCQGANLQLEGSLFPNAINPWESLNPATATVDNLGLVTGVSAGIATIRYINLGGCTTTIPITINPILPVADPLDITVCSPNLPPYVINIDQNVIMLSTVPLADQGNYVIKYYENLNDANNDAPTNIDFVSVGALATYQVSMVPRTIYVRIEDLVTKGCYNIRSFVIDVVISPSGTFNYTGGPYCNNDTALKLPTLFTLTSGGTYSATPVGLSINPATGAIDGVASTVGLYTVFYDIAATALCPAFNTTGTVDVVGCNCTVIASSTSQTVCVNTSITAITYSSSTIATTGSVAIADLPPGVTGAFAGNVFTISGTPNIPGTYTFSVSLETGTSDSCSIVTTIVVNAQPDAGLDGCISVSDTNPATIDLYNLIDGEQVGGVWTRTAGTGGTFSAVAGTYNPAIGATTSTFEYKVFGVAPCIDALSIATIIINGPPNGAAVVIFCDGANSTANSLAFDWNNVGQASFNYAYSINGGPIVRGTTIVSNYQVLNVPSGSSVTFTVLPIGNICFPATTTTCDLLSDSNFDSQTVVYYPNPFNEVLNLKLAQSANNIQIFNLLGQQVFANDFYEKEIQINLSHLSSGTYLVKANALDSFKTFKIVKN